MTGPRLVDILEMVRSKIPEGKEAGAKAKFNLDKKAVAENLETRYALPINRLKELSYFIDAASTFCGRPEPTSNKGINLSAHDYQNMQQEQIDELNIKFTAWAATHALREFVEFLNYYLLQVYETCLLINLGSDEVGVKEMDEIFKKGADFEDKNLSERFAELKKESGAHTEYRDELSSLYKARNIFAHFDGLIQKSDIEPDGTFKIKWPRNRYTLHRKSDGKEVRFDKVPKPFASEQYDKVSFQWFHGKRLISYSVGQKIQFSTTDLYELNFFFMYVIDEIHAGVVNYARSNNIPAREFKNYQVKLELNFR